MLGPAPPPTPCRLGGELRPVAHAERRVAEAAKLGFSTVLVSAASAPSARGRLAGARIVPCRTVVEALHAALGQAVFAKRRSGRPPGAKDDGAEARADGEESMGEGESADEVEQVLG